MSSCANLELTDNTAPPFARKIEPPLCATVNLRSYRKVVLRRTRM
jgi:hypothetical protein